MPDNGYTIILVLATMKPASPLLQLPRELRDMIYAYTVALDTDNPDAYDVLIGESFAQIW